MATTLLTTGLLCVIAAIVGGGIEAFGGKVPVIQSSKRQTALGLFGIILLLGALYSSSSKDQAETVTVNTTGDQVAAARVQVTDVVVQPVNDTHPTLLGIQGVAHLENVGKVPITAGCPEATAILQFMVPSPDGPRMTPSSWRTLGQQHAGCTVKVGIGEAPTFPIYITFAKPTEDSLFVNLMVQFHKDGIPFGTVGRDNSRVWAASAKARLP
jgi:hypothetical protein